MVLSLLLAQAAFGTAVAGPEAAVAAKPAAAVIVARDPPWLPYTSMQRALAAFEQYHTLAPDADARFVLRPQTGVTDTTGLMLSVAQGDDTTLVPVMGDGSFSLPPALRGTAPTALALNRDQALFRWRPLVRSPGLAATVLRLGDLRLECQMLWAVQVVPGADGAAAANPCLTAGAGTDMPTPARTVLAAATLVAGGRRLALPLAPDGLAYRAPLADTGWPDDALIALTPVP